MTKSPHKVISFSHISYRPARLNILGDESVSKADGLNQDKTQRDVMTPMGGVRPIRKKGYHRALKRGEIWARIKKFETSMLERISSDLFYRDVLTEITGRKNKT